ncbi:MULTISPECIES: DivIVA domain-containing protein [Micrococcaceae]|uniref:DivIVA domain-containing protein n=1 Tax=unclassified Kocuria TaxID=2649579 RepID=UPI0010109415|nr:MULTISPECIES: DivIVA domain-containing protein [unclassified Kocuria]
MALTPEQVINKTFQPTKFREGYDQEEVDLFLDEVVSELRRLNKENDDLRQKLEEAGIDPDSGSVSSAAGSQGNKTSAAETSDAASVAALNVEPDSSSDVEPENLDSEIHPTNEQVPTAAEKSGSDQPGSGTTAAQASAETTSESSVRENNVSGQSNESAASAAAVIAMAQRLHDDYVSQGESEKARLIEEGQTTANSLLSEAEAKRSEILASLEESKTNLETDVETLRSFETKYRRELKSYLEGKLTDLENSPRVEPTQTR